MKQYLFIFTSIFLFFLIFQPLMIMKKDEVDSEKKDKISRESLILWTLMISLSINLVVDTIQGVYS